MSLSELAERITASLRTSAALLHQLHEGLAQRRTAWVAAKPSTLHEPAQVLARAAQDLATESTRLQELFAAAKALLPYPPAQLRSLHVDATLLAQQLPPQPAARLRQASALATDAARRVRIEHALGERLLRFSQHTKESLMASVAQTLATTALDVGGYDRGARRVNVALKAGAAPGSLIDGRM